MRFSFNDEQQQLRDIARKFLAAHSTSSHVRKAMQDPLGWLPDVWTKVAGELGWTALSIPETYGGFGFGAVEVVAVMEEMGRANFCSPYLASIGLAANVLLLAGDDTQKSTWLPELAGGKVGTVAWMSRDGRWDAGAVQATYTTQGDSVVINGDWHYVLDATAAEVLVLAARSAGSSGTDGIALFVTAPAQEGIAIAATPTLDPTRKLGRLEARNLKLPAAARLTGALSGGAALTTALDLARIALSAEQVGGAQACLDMAVDYAKVRQQFGTPIGRFQAIKHKCADMMVKVEAARSAAYYAGWAAAHAPAELHDAAMIAQAYCSEAFFHCASENIQIHGGIGFTWEHDAHLYFKRAKSGEELFGTPAQHRRWYADAIGL